MIVVRQLTGPLTFAPRVDDQALVGEDVILKVTRTGFQLTYLPRSGATWRRFKPALPLMTLVDDPQSAVYLVWEDDRRVLGWAIVTEGPDGWAELLDIRTDATVRRSGYGAMLVDVCRGFADQHGQYGLRAATSDQNPVMCRFCEAEGFQLGGVDRLALAMDPQERAKPLLQRTCQLTFYLPNQKG